MNSQFKGVYCVACDRIEVVESDYDVKECRYCKSTELKINEDCYVSNAVDIEPSTDEKSRELIKGLYTKLQNKELSAEEFSKAVMGIEDDEESNLYNLLNVLDKDLMDINKPIIEEINKLVIEEDHKILICENCGEMNIVDEFDDRVPMTECEDCGITFCLHCCEFNEETYEYTCVDCACLEEDRFNFIIRLYDKLTNKEITARAFAKDIIDMGSSERHNLYSLLKVIDLSLFDTNKAIAEEINKLIEYDFDKILVCKHCGNVGIPNLSNLECCEHCDDLFNGRATTEIEIEDSEEFTVIYGEDK